MSIRKVEVDEYDHSGIHPGRLIVSEFAGQVVLEIVGSNKVQVYWEDLERAWRAVQR